MSPWVFSFISRMIVIVIATILTPFDVAEAQRDSCRCRFDPPFISDSSISLVFPDTVEIDGYGLEIDSCSHDLLALSPDQLAARLYVRAPLMGRRGSVFAPRRVVPGPSTRLPAASDIMLTAVRVEPDPADETLRILYRPGAAARVRIELIDMEGKLVDLLGEGSDVRDLSCLSGVHPEHSQRPVRLSRHGERR